MSLGHFEAHKNVYVNQYTTSFRHIPLKRDRLLPTENMFLKVFMQETLHLTDLHICMVEVWMFINIQQAFAISLNGNVEIMIGFANLNFAHLISTGHVAIIGFYSRNVGIMDSVTLHQKYRESICSLYKIQDCNH